MSKKDEALKLALEYMNEYYPIYAKQAAHHHRVSTALREALAEQPAQPDWEAVAADQAMTIALLRAEQPAQQEPVATLFGSLPVYDTSPPAQRKPLTDEQVWNNDELMKLNAVMMLPMDYFMRVVRAIESAHGVKENT